MDQANTTAALPAAEAVPIVPVLVSATLVAPTTVTVKLPLASTVGSGFDTNMTVCAGALELLAAGTNQPKPAPFTACALSTDTVTLTLAGPYGPGDAVNVVSGQSTLLFGTTAYGSAAPIVIRPTLSAVSLTSPATVSIAFVAPVAKLGATADCNAAFVLKLANGSAVASPFASCADGPEPTTIVATFSANTSFVGGMTVNVRANQTVVTAGTASGPAFIPRSADLQIRPSILGASLSGASTIIVSLPVNSTTSGSLDAAGCNAMFLLRAAGASVAKVDPFFECALGATRRTFSLTLASGVTVSPGDMVDVQSTNTGLLVGTAAYVPRAVPVLPSVAAAYLVGAATVHVLLPMDSAVPANYSAADCTRSIIISAVNSTDAKPIAACSMAPDSRALAVTLGTGASFASGDTVNVKAGQWQLRAGKTVVVGPAYTSSPETVAIRPAFESATLLSATSVLVELPVASSAGSMSAADCNAAFDLSGKEAPFTGCSLGATNTTMVFNLTDTAYTAGDTIAPKSTNNKLSVGTTFYGPLRVAIKPTLVATTKAVLTSPTQITVTLPYPSSLSSTNATDCNAAFELTPATGAAKPAAFSACSVTGGGLTLTLTLTADSVYTPGDRLDVKSGQQVFSGSGAVYTQASSSVVITPTIVSAAVYDASTIFVTLSATGSALNDTQCNSAFSVTGKPNVFANCTLTADGKAMTLVLTSPGSVSAGDLLNLASGQTALLAGTSTAAFVPAASNIALRQSQLSAVFITAPRTLVAVMSVPVSAADIASACNSVFTLAMANGTVKANPFESCSLDSDGVSITLSTTSSVYTTGDTLNIVAGQSTLFILAASGPAFVNQTTAVTVAPAISSAVATAHNTIVVPLPLESVGAACSSGVIVKSSAGVEKTVTGCSVSADKLTMTVTISGSGTNADAPFAAGDTINVRSSNTILRATSVSGTPYAPLDDVTVFPSLGTASVVSRSSITVSLPAATTTAVSPLTAADCNSAIAILSTGGTPYSSPIASCSVSGSSLSIELSGTYTAGDRINVLDTNNVIQLGTGASAVLYEPLPTAATLNPTFASAKATSGSKILVTLPAVSLFFTNATNTTAYVIDKASCDTVLAVSSRTLDATGSCNLNWTTGATFNSMEVKLATDSYAPGDTITVASVNDLFRAGSRIGPLYTPRTVTIDPAYVTSVVATDSKTIVVTLPVSSSLYSGSTAVESPLDSATCSSVLEVRSSAGAKQLASCALSGTALTVTLAGTGSDVYAAGDTFSFKDTNTLLRAGASSASLAYKALPTALTISPTLSKAVTSQADTVTITLPTATNTFMVGTTATATLTDVQCNSIIAFTSSRALKPGAGACTLSGNALTVKLTAGVLVAEDTVNVPAVVNGQTVFLKAGTGASGPTYVAAAPAVMVAPGYLLRAIARGPQRIDVVLPYLASFYDGGLQSTLNKEKCGSVVEVLANGAASAPRVLATATPCSLTTNTDTLTIILDSTETFATGDTVRIKDGNTLLVVGNDAGNAAYVQGVNATAVSLGYLNAGSALALSATATAATLSITLPATVSIVSGGSIVTTLSQANCDAAISLVSGTGAAIAACSLTGTTLQVNITATSGAYTPGTTTIDFKSGQTVLVTGTTVTSPPVQQLLASLGGPMEVNPAFLTSAVMSDSDTVVVTFASNLDTTAITQVGCASAVEVRASGNTTSKRISSCSVSGAALTVNLDGETVAPGDVFVIKSGQSIVKTSSGALPYGAVSAVAISPGYMTSAVAIASNKLVIKLPFASTLKASPTCQDIVTVKDSSTEKATGCTATLDTTTRTYLTIELAGGVTSIANTWTVDFKGAADLTVGTSGTGARYMPWPLAAANLKTITAYTITATAMGSNKVQVKLPMPASMAALQASACSGGAAPVVTVAGSTLAAAPATACQIVGTNSDILELTFGTLVGGTAITTCEDIFSIGLRTGLTCTNPSNTNQLTITIPSTDYAPDTDILNLDAAKQIASNAATNQFLRTENTISGVLLSAAASPGLQVVPSFVSATLTSSFTVSVALPVRSMVPAGWGSAADCNAVFELYTFASPTPALKANPIQSCSLSADGKTVTLTLATAALPRDLINIKTGQTALVAYSATPANRHAYVARPSSVTVVPSLVSAFRSGDIVYVKLPYASFTSNTLDGNTVLDDTTWICVEADVAVYSVANAQKPGAAAATCQLKKDVLIYTLQSGNAWAAGDYIKLGASTTLRADVGATLAYRNSINIPIYNAGILKATAVSSTSVLVDLPTVSTITGSPACTSYLSYGKATSCALSTSGTTLTVTLSPDSPFLSGDTVGIVGSQSILGYSRDGVSPSPGYYGVLSPATMLIRPTIVSAYIVSSTQVAVVLPASSRLYATTTPGTPVLEGNKALCDGVFDVTDAASSKTKATSDTACQLSTDGTIMTITMAGSLAAGDAVNIASAHEAASTNMLYVGSTSPLATATQAKYTARAVPVTIAGRIVSASAVSATSIEVVLPLASSLFDSSNVAVTSPTKAQCDTIVQVSTGATPKGLAATSPCSLSANGLTLTVNLASPYAPGDTINIAAANSILRLGTASTGPRYEPSTTGVPVTLAYFVSAIATDSRTIVVTLPFPAAIYSAGSTGTPVATPTKAQCDMVVRAVGLTLDTTNPCAIEDGTKLTLKLTASPALAAGDKVDVAQVGNPATDVVLRVAATAENIAATSTPFTRAPSASATTGAAVIAPTITSAVATAPSTIVATLSLAGSLAGTSGSSGIDCASIVVFNPQKTLVTGAAACSVSGTLLTINLAGASAGTAGVYAGGDTVNIAATNAAALSYPLKTSSGSIFFVANPAAAIISPNLHTATAIGARKLEVGLPAPSYLPDTALTSAECLDILTLSSGVTTLADANPCVLDSTKQILTVTFKDDQTAYADGLTVNVDSAALTDATKGLRAGSSATGPLYVAGTAVPVKPTFVSAKATSARTLVVTLPATSSLSSGTVLTATECSSVLEVRSASAVRVLDPTAACSVTDSGATLTVLLQTKEAFAAGDTINVLAANAATAAKYLQVGSTKYVPRSAPVTVAPAYLVAAFAATPTEVWVQLPTASYMVASDEPDCAKVVDVRQAGAAAAKSLAATGACSVVMADGNYYMRVVLASANPFAPGDEVKILATNSEATSPLRGGTTATGLPYQATTAVAVSASLGAAILVDGITLVVDMPGTVSADLVDKARCDEVFSFTNAAGEARTSPIASCTRVSSTIEITLSTTDPLAPGDRINIRKDQTNAKLGAAALVPSPTAVTVLPAIFGSSATVVAPGSVALTLPAASSLPDATTAAVCNSIVRVAPVSGAVLTSPVSTCALSADARVLTLGLANTYAAGDAMNIKDGNTALKWGPAATGAPYVGLEEDVPVLTTVVDAVLTSANTLSLALPTASATPANFALEDCARALQLSSRDGAAKSFSSCTLSADRLSLELQLPAGGFAAGDVLNVKQGQAELRAASMEVGPAYVPKAAAQPLQPTPFSTFKLTGPDTVEVVLPYASALAAGSACPLVLATSAGAKDVASCSLAADQVTLTATLGADAKYTAGSTMNLKPAQKALTMADGTTAYAASRSSAVINPTITSAFLPSPSTITVTLPTASALTANTADACNAAVSVQTAAGTEVASPFASCSISTDGLSLSLQVAASYTPADTDTLDIKDGQTVLRAGSSSGPVYVKRSARAKLTTPTPPPPSPTPSPPPPPPSTNFTARGLSTGYLVCNVVLGNSANSVEMPTTNGSFAATPSATLSMARFRSAECKDFVTGATVIDSTVASYVLPGMDGLTVSPMSALAYTALPADTTAVTFSATLVKMLAKLQLPVDKYAATPLVKYDYYDNTFITPSASGAAVTNINGLVSANLKMFASWFDGLTAAQAGVEFTAPQALLAAQKVLAAELLSNTTTDLNANTSIVALLNRTYALLTSAPTAAARHLLQGAQPFSAVEASATALAQSVSDSNKLIAAQQETLLRALATGQTLSAEQLQSIILESARTVATQSTVLASAAQGLANGSISTADFLSRYSGDNLRTLVAQQELNSGIGGSVTPPPSPPPAEEDEESNTGLIIGLVVGLVGGAILIAIIVAVIIARRRKQSVVAQKQQAGEV